MDYTISLSAHRTAPGFDVNDGSSFKVTSNGTLYTANFAIRSGGFEKMRSSGAPVTKEKQLLHPFNAGGGDDMYGDDGGGHTFGAVPADFDGAVGAAATHASRDVATDTLDVPSSSSSVSRSRSASESTIALSGADIVKLCSVGQGASGCVFRVLHKPTLRLMALKSIDITDKSKRHQLERELLALDTSTSPFIVDFYGCYFEDNSTKLALEYMNRGSLEGILERHGALHHKVLQSITHQVTLGLDHMHRIKHQVSFAQLRVRVCACVYVCVVFA
jgi:hypothetical protein